MCVDSLADLTRLVRSVHRRQIWVRSAERIGLGVAAGCAAALAPTIVLLLHHRSPILWVEVSLIGGVLAGIAWSILRVADPLQAAIAIDRQLDLAELLSSAWLLQSTVAADEPWRNAILTQAAQRSRSISASSVKVSHLPRRAWGGIALCLGLLFTLCCFAPGARQRQALSHGPNYAMTSSAENESNRPLLDLSAPLERPVLLADPDDPNASRLGQNESASPADPKSTSGSADDSSNRTQTASKTPGIGSGSARTDAPREQGGNLSERPAVAPSEHRTQGGAGHPAGGAGASASAGPAGNDVAAGGAVTGGSPRQQETPPWKSPTWPATVKRTQRALATGTIPPAYRDLVREYFMQH